MDTMDEHFSWAEYYALHDGTSRYGNRKTLTQADIIAAMKAEEAKHETAKSAKTCPKCGKALGRGGHFHISKCDGTNDAA